MLSTQQPQHTWQFWPQPQAPQPSHRDTLSTPRIRTSPWSSSPSHRRDWSNRSYRPTMTSPLTVSSSPPSPPTTSPLTPSTPAQIFGPSVADLARSEPTPPRPMVGPAAARKVMSKDAQTQARRKLFLNKVRQGGDDRRWESRATDLDRLDRAEWEREMRAWEEAKLREAPEITEEQDEEDQQTENDMGQEDEVEDVAMREQRELEELVAMMELNSQPMQMEEHIEQDTTNDAWATGQRNSQYSDHFGSDDEDFDAILGSLIEDMSSRNGDGNDNDVMDMTE
ncbi:hypothetical protein BDZ85DRAFT_261346 [Elsinoe ampelina]|uniref:Uncharacterized protein n=1 Tax=Elsinoe ampelina TaxID=302913 RepID=A0A6A6GC55_9PEZI|nr:hypothetical protein BDZ85DRAFT_261346 [Elsinoe ampelina]